MQVLDNINDILGDSLKEQLTPGTKLKITCTRKLFAKIMSEQIKYGVACNYGKLMGPVK